MYFAIIKIDEEILRKQKLREDRELYEFRRIMSLQKAPVKENETKRERNSERNIQEIKQENEMKDLKLRLDEEYINRKRLRELHEKSRKEEKENNLKKLESIKKYKEIKEKEKHNEVKSLVST